MSWQIGIPASAFFTFFDKLLGEQSSVTMMTVAADRGSDLPGRRQAMTKTMHGKVHGRTIELDEDVGVPEGQEVEVQVKIVEPPKSRPTMSEGLAKVYEILGRRHSSGCTDTAERHNEHQP
jgi:hypothetical protein